MEEIKTEFLEEDALEFRDNTIIVIFSTYRTLCCLMLAIYLPSFRLNGHMSEAFDSEVDGRNGTYCYGKT